MAKVDYSHFHELAEQFRGEMPLKELCEKEGVSYRAYIIWRSKFCGVAGRGVGSTDKCKISDFCQVL